MQGQNPGREKRELVRKRMCGGIRPLNTETLLSARRQHSATSGCVVSPWTPDFTALFMI